MAAAAAGRVPGGHRGRDPGPAGNGRVAVCRGVAGEVDSRAYHLSAADQDRTTERHDRLIAHGIFPLHFPPKRIKTDPAGIIREIRAAIEEGRRRPPLPITALPAAG